VGHRGHRADVERLGVGAVHGVAGAQQAPVQVLDFPAHDAKLRHQPYSDADFVRSALAEAAARRAESQPHVAQQLAAARAELARTEEARDRHFRAFEAGTMSAQDCAERVRSLAQRIDELRGRPSELEEATAGEPSLEVSEVGLRRSSPHSEMRLKPDHRPNPRPRPLTMVSRRRIVDLD
jgi:hypothetical protein